MRTLNIVLVEPQIPQNTGNIARTCAATNVKMHIVRPMGFKVSDKHLKRAGLDYWNFLDISYYDNINELYEKNRRCKFYYFTTKAVNKYTDVSYEDNCFLVFGREDKGIDEDILYRNKDKCVRLPMATNIRSLNLSNTVIVGIYEVLRQWDFCELIGNGNLTKYKW